METCRRESLHAPRYRKVSGPHSDVDPYNGGELEGRQAKAGRVSRSGGRSATGVGPPTLQ